MTSTESERRGQTDGEGGGWEDECCQIVQTDSPEVFQNMKCSACEA